MHSLLIKVFVSVLPHYLSYDSFEVLITICYNDFLIWVSHSWVRLSEVEIFVLFIFMVPEPVTVNMHSITGPWINTIIVMYFILLKLQWHLFIYTINPKASLNLALSSSVLSPSHPFYFSHIVWLSALRTPLQASVLTVLLLSEKWGVRG